MIARAALVLASFDIQMCLRQIEPLAACDAIDLHCTLDHTIGRWSTSRRSSIGPSRRMSNGDWRAPRNDLRRGTIEGTTCTGVAIQGFGPSKDQDRWER